MKNELTHHGILGMKWGKRNGPPYPIEDYSKYSEEERNKMKTKAIRDGNVKEADANKIHFTDNELKAVRDRYKLNKELSDLAKSDIKSGQQKVENFESKFKTVSNLVGTIATGAKNGVDAYNNIGAVLSYMNGTEFKPIKLDSSGNNNNNNGGGKKKKKK